MTVVRHTINRPDHLRRQFGHYSLKKHIKTGTIKLLEIKIMFLVEFAVRCETAESVSLVLQSA